jgi:hypothetical protein
MIHEAQHGEPPAAVDVCAPRATGESVIEYLTRLTLAAILLCDGVDHLRESAQANLDDIELCRGMGIGRDGKQIE